MLAAGKLRNIRPAAGRNQYPFTGVGFTVDRYLMGANNGGPAVDQFGASVC